MSVTSLLNSTILQLCPWLCFSNEILMSLNWCGLLRTRLSLSKTGKLNKSLTKVATLNRPNLHTSYIRKEIIKDPTDILEVEDVIREWCNVDDRPVLITRQWP